ncbi:hypothetical protein HJFPF1_13475 [Paramyrothecium foliicola]|nr:hypothetical protein HJFPF1_13475 [Paramyrothecium foliicola]
MRFTTTAILIASLVAGTQARAGRHFVRADSIGTFDIFTDDSCDGDGVGITVAKEDSSGELVPAPKAVKSRLPDDCTRKFSGSHRDCVFPYALQIDTTKQFFELVTLSSDENSFFPPPTIVTSFQKDQCIVLSNSDIDVLKWKVSCT